MAKNRFMTTASIVVSGCLLAGASTQASAQSSEGLFNSLSSVGGHTSSTASSQSSESLSSVFESESSENDSKGLLQSDIAFRLAALAANTPSANGGALETLTSSAYAFGSSGVPLVRTPELPAGFPKPVDYSITKPRLLRKVNEEGIRLQRWFIESPAMKRVVEVQVMLPADLSVPSPMLYMLDGISAERTSGWLQHSLPKFFEDKNVTIVMPTEAPGSLYTDWQKPDPQLGVMKWETFLSKELPQVMESAEAGLSFNGKRGIGGLSMGAMGAVRNAALHPDVWHAVMGISGCYSSTSDLGHNITDMVVAVRGGNPENMWGEFGSEDWVRNDIPSNPEGLRNTSVFLGAADGYINESFLEIYRDTSSIGAMLSGAVLEKGSNRCTMRLDEAMKKAGMNHQKVLYSQGGAHLWQFFNQMLEPGWNHIKGALGR